MIHVDIMKFGSIRDGGRWPFTGRIQGERDREATATRVQSRNHRYQPSLRIAFTHTVIDDHSRVTYAQF